MDEDYSPSNWAFYYQEEGVNELKHTLLYTTLELENTLVAANEELARKNDELVHLKTLLTKTIKEKEEAHSKCQIQIQENLLLQQKLQQKKMHTTQAIVCPDEPSPQGDSVTRCSSSDCDENVTASSPPPLEVAYHQLLTNKTLPENGKFLQAVMEAGPLLQTLLVVGPLPQWQHPPPQLKIIEIPPVTIQSPRNTLLGQDSCFSKKRGDLFHGEEFELSPNGKNQKVVHL